MRYVELLAPAKDLACGKAAIDHGADAVYIGASRFGARAQAGNSVSDIAELCRYAHLFGVKVYVTVNTIIYDSELEQTTALVSQLGKVGVDAILVQDMGLLSLLALEGQGSGEWRVVNGVEANPQSPITNHQSPITNHQSPLPLPLHASTQTDNRTAEKVRWLSSLGISRVVLARELSLAEIRAIHEAVPDTELEVFVHGALCVSYSGLCYASEHCFRRSANRGECAQFCRMKFNLIDSNDRLIERDKYLLSLKDLCQAERLEDILEAGATSLKIEGRLKDVAYVKNVVAAYSQELNRVIARNPGKYRRSSWGRVEYRFTPDLGKTFNRSYTNYFLNGRQPGIASFLTPKAIGQRVGKVKTVGPRHLTVAGVCSFANGDGLCYYSDEGSLVGFRVNKVSDGRLYPQRMPNGLKPGMVLYRNHDETFQQQLQATSAVRKVPTDISLVTTPNGFELRMACQGVSISQPIAAEHQPANKPQHSFMAAQLSKLGNTVFEASRIDIDEQAASCFLPGSKLAEARRSAVAQLERGIYPPPATPQNAPHQSPIPNHQSPITSHQSPVTNHQSPLTWQPEYRRYPYLYNIANRAARDFYAAQGMSHPEPAFELRQSPSTSHIPQGGGKTGASPSLIMQCRHCLRYSLGYCERHGGQRPTWREPLFLELSDKRRFRLQFDCKVCQMNIYASNNHEQFK